MRLFKLFLPNFITSLNLLSGCVAIICTLDSQVNAAEYAPFLIILAAGFDLLDGMVARALKAQSEFGKQFDSLADIISFGIAPAVIMYEILRWSITDVHSEPFRGMEQGEFILVIIPFTALLIVAAAGVRLARFNIQGEENSYFKGLPTPASALFIVGLRILMIEPSSETFFHNVLLNINYNIVFILLLSILMISNIHMISFKFSSFELKKNTFRYFLIIISLVLILWFKQQALILIMLAYIVLSVIHHLINKPAG